MKKTLGGDRLGSGKKMEVAMHGYERTTFNTSYLWRSTMSAGTIVPFLKEIGLPGTTMDIDLNLSGNTHPTVGPLFGSFKAECHVFVAPIRLYQGQLHNNKLGIGMNMANVKLPLIQIPVPVMDVDNMILTDYDNSQINPSSLYAYLGMRGAGVSNVEATTREFNAIPLLAYWDIYKNYFSNKMEEIGAVIHSDVDGVTQNVASIAVDGQAVSHAPGGVPRPLLATSRITITLTAPTGQPLEDIMVMVTRGGVSQFINMVNLGTIVQQSSTVFDIQYAWGTWGVETADYWEYISPLQLPTKPIEVTLFPLEDIDTMRERILAHAVNADAFVINEDADDLKPYMYNWETAGSGATQQKAIMQSQEGLGIKTYQSDLLNNWLNTEMIDGPNGISAITAVDTSEGEFNIETLILAKKVYELLNRIMVSGGTYKNWIEAAYDDDSAWIAESPIYAGGLSKEIIFQEVVSNAESAPNSTGSQPLGTLAGKGIMSSKHKGGRITVKIDEPSYVIGVVCLTPRIDYSQGNDWDVNLKTMDDFHKPGLDQIGFQESINEQRAWWTTGWDAINNTWLQTSAGKVPAWINYMTNINKVRGNFAIPDNEMFMVLTRRYEPEVTNVDYLQIKDLTTYIDPSKFNHIFAQTSLDSQNFWIQISVDMTARRKQSGKLMPNL